jgi:hypothetical protein
MFAITVSLSSHLFRLLAGLVALVSVVVAVAVELPAAK